MACGGDPRSLKEERMRAGRRARAETYKIIVKLPKNPWLILDFFRAV